MVLQPLHLNKGASGGGQRPVGARSQGFLTAVEGHSQSFPALSPAQLVGAVAASHRGSLGYRTSSYFFFHFFYQFLLPSNVYKVLAEIHPLLSWDALCVPS